MNFSKNPGYFNQFILKYMQFSFILTKLIKSHFNPIFRMSTTYYDEMFPDKFAKYILFN